MELKCEGNNDYYVYCNICHQKKLVQKLVVHYDILDVVDDYFSSRVAATEKLNITMKNTGDGDAVLHVYNYFDMIQDPNEYTIDAGKSLYDLFDTNSDTATYNYSLCAPHGYVKQFSGSSLISNLVHVEMKEYGVRESISVIFRLKKPQGVITTAAVTRGTFSL